MKSISHTLSLIFLTLIIPTTFLNATDFDSDSYEVIVSFNNEKTRDIFWTAYRERQLLKVAELAPNKLVFRNNDGEPLDLEWANQLESIFTNEKYRALVANFEKNKITGDLINGFFSGRWQLLSSTPCDSNGGTWVSYDKDGSREFLNGKLNSSPNDQEINVSIVDINKVRIEHTIFSNTMMTEMNNGVQFPVYIGEKIFTLISPEEYSYVHKYEEIELAKFLANPTKKIYTTKTEDRTAKKCE